MSQSDLKQVKSHFAFGKNWASYIEQVSEGEIEEAQQGLLKLVPIETLKGASFLDIGCGSGLHALAAAGLGVGRILATDIDPESVRTTQNLLQRHNLPIPWETQLRSVFDLDSNKIGTFDIVYSWGVLHHTGDMWDAIEKAASFVKPHGLFVLALYRSTYLDALWQKEKHWYTNASLTKQARARNVYQTLMHFAFLLRGRSFRDHQEEYKRARGMDFSHDVHDWLGGYPYETAAPSDVDKKMHEIGFRKEHVFARSRKGIGFFGSGCDEYVYRRNPKRTVG